MLWHQSANTHCLRCCCCCCSCCSSSCCCCCCACYRRCCCLSLYRIFMLEARIFNSFRRETLFLIGNWFSTKGKLVKGGGREWEWGRERVCYICVGVREREREAILLTTKPLVEQMDYVLFRTDKQNTCENKLWWGWEADRGRERERERAREEKR